MSSWSQWLPLQVEAGADAAQRLLGPLNMAGAGDGKGGDGGEGTLIYVFLTFMTVCVCCSFGYICKNCDCKSKGSAGERKGQRILSRHKSKRVVPTVIKVRPRRNYEDDMANYVKKKATGGNAVVDRMYGGDRQFGSGKREKDAFKPPKLVSSIYGDMSHTSSKAISYKI